MVRMLFVNLLLPINKAYQAPSLREDGVGVQSNPNSSRASSLSML